MAKGRGLPDYESPMDAARLAEYRRRLSTMQPFALRRLYEEVWRGCRPVEHGLPSGRAIQELVQVWKELRKSK